MFTTTVAKKRLIGIILLVIILALFSAFNRFPKLDIIGEDLGAITSPDNQCFQGFCIEREPGSSFLTNWISFSVTYLRLITVGMTFAFLTAGLAEAFLFPRSLGVGFQSGGIFKRTLQGAAIGPVMNLCSACIVPVSSAFHRRAGLEGAIAMVQGSATMNIPALAMVFFVFTPMLGLSRLLLAVIGALIIGPLVVATIRKERGPDLDIPTIAAEVPVETAGWKSVLHEGTRIWAKTSIGYLVRMGPIMIIAGFASGLAIQWLRPETVAEYLGNDFRGVAIAATFGILINVPLLFEIPLVALLLLMGMGTAPAATLLFAAAAGGPVTFWGMSKLMPKRALTTFVAATWTIGAFGGLTILAIGATIWEGGGLNQRIANAAQGPTIRHVVERSERPLFIDVTDSAGIDFSHKRIRVDAVDVGAGALVFDYNGDGLDDLYLANSDGPNALYRNNGDHTFTDVAVAAGLDDPAGGESNGGCAADYDNDGDQDLLVTHFGASRLFRNNGDGTFADVTAASLGAVSDEDRTMGCAWADYDRDGFLDLVLVSHVRIGEDESLFEINVEELRDKKEFLELHDPVHLYHNNGDGTFSETTTLLGDPSSPTLTGPLGNLWGSGFQPVWIDYDNDDDPDLYVVNDFGDQVQPNVLWRNDGPSVDGGWTFTDISQDSGAGVPMFGMGVAVGDYNLDGRFDLFMTNIGNNVLLSNDGPDFGFTNTALDSGTGVGYFTDGSRVAWGTFFFDYDNDRDEDLYIVSGFLNARNVTNPRDQANVLLRNDGDGSFIDVSPGSGADDSGVGRGGVYLDYDHDGCLDILISNLRGSARLLRNTCESGYEWLEVDLIGTTSNRDGIGARITVVSGTWALMREVAAGSSQMGQNTLTAHFGLGSGQIQKVKFVLIRWPSGKLQVLKDVPTRQRIVVTEPG